MLVMPVMPMSMTGFARRAVRWYSGYNDPPIPRWLSQLPVPFRDSVELLQIPPTAGKKKKKKKPLIFFLRI